MFWSKIVKLLGPAKTKFLAVSTPTPLIPYIRIFIFIILVCVPKPYVPICLE